MTYTVLDHVADVKFRAEGDTLAEALSSVVEAFAEITGADDMEPTATHDFSVESENVEALLFDFLDRLVLLQDVEDAAVVSVEEISLHDMGDALAVKATVNVADIGERGLLDIKAPTYSDMVVEEDDGWLLEAVLDV